MNRHTDDEVPQHPCLELVSNSEEKLTLLISRRLITMKKIAEYDPSYGQSTEFIPAKRRSTRHSRASPLYRSN